MRESKTPALIVGIGASAGGVDAFLELLRHLPGDTGLAYVFLLHMSPAHKSHLAEILGRASKMPVREARDGRRLEANQVYVMPPNAAMTLIDGRFNLAPLPPRARNPIDLFFRSLAQDRKTRAVGIVLSGMASDGTAGLEEIKAAGGIACAQDAKSAAYPGMPRAAVAAGFADIVRPPKGLALELIRLGRHPLTRIAQEGDAAIFGDAASLDAIFALLRSTSGVDFSLYKPSTMRRRISRRMFLLDLARLKDYLAHLRSKPGEVRALYDDLLINVTSFFRDPKAFEALKKKVFPRVVKGRRAGAPVRFWVAGCASGEEAYSLAIAYLEFMRERGVSVPAQIFATDISDEAAGKARRGVYPENIADSMPAEVLRRYFIKSPQGYQVTKQLRDMCIFAHHDVTADPPFANQDLISCRNLLIYLEPVLQRAVLSTFHYALRPEGYLLLGGAETLGGCADLFVEVDKKANIFAKKPARASQLRLVAGRAAAARKPAAAGTAYPRPPQPATGDALAYADRLVLGRFSPPAVLVNRDLDILQFRGETSRFLKAAPGKASLNLLRMAPEGLRLDLQLLVQKAFKSHLPVRKTNAWVRLDRRARLITLEAAAFDVPPGKERYCLVSFLPPTASPAAPAGRPAKEPRHRLFQTLKRELSETKAYLQTRIEESESRNAALNVANEEVISTNEELQSTNEELESSREELQTANEELNTLNDELRKQNAALIQLGGDLDNVLESLAIPVALLGLDLRIRRVTLLEGTPLDLTQADAGRSILDIQKKLGLPDLEERAVRTLKTSRGQDLELTGKDGRWYKLRMRPYKTAQGKIEGLVLALLDADVAKRGLLDLQDVMEQSMAILDADLRVQSANRRFYEQFRLTARRAQGRPFVDLAGGAAASLLQRRLREALARGTPFRGLELELRDRRLGQRLLRLGAVRVPDAGRAALYVGVRDITDIRRAETHQRLAERERSQREFIANVSHELRTPVTAIKGYAQTLKQGGLHDEKRRLGFVDTIERNADRLAGLIDALLRISALSERPSPRRRPVALAGLVRRCAAAAGPLARKNRVALRVDVPAGLAASADAGQIRDVLRALIDNAVKFSRPGGRVAITAREAGGEAVVSVEDQGIGIAERDLPHLFERFFRGRNAKAAPGAGLGLSIVQQIVAAHGGRIWADARRRAGAALRFTLPLAGAQAPSRP